MLAPSINSDKMTPAIYICRDNKSEITLEYIKPVKHKRGPERCHRTTKLFVHNLFASGL